jgi:hypothetical protein
MSEPAERSREGWSYCGEVWTDADGRAVVVLPPFVRAHQAGFHYELTPVDRGCAARVAAEIDGDRFTVQTDEPHTKVAWQVTALRAARDSHRSGEEEPLG